MSDQPRTSIMFVCLGNICRSPLAEGIFRQVVAQAGAAERFEIDSAGTGAWHVGSPPDPRSVDVARRHGIDLTGQRARRLGEGDFARFDLLLGMDRSNVETMKATAPAGYAQRVHLFGAYATGQSFEVPDPYYDREDGFERVYLMLREASDRLVDRLVRASVPPSGQVSSIR
jgi:protein-tyrosine phosphatase